MSLIYDSHIHLMPDCHDTPETFLANAKEAGICGGIIFSLPPSRSLLWKDVPKVVWKDRIANVLDYCAKLENYYPFFWIDPTEPDAVAQVEYAKSVGILGFKVLCSDYYPWEGMDAYRKAAELRMPIIFHSGILWDGRPSANFNRPGNFECMLDIPCSRFCLAHFSWPWTDENLAVFGKIHNAHGLSKDAPDMYIDTSWGAMDLFREEIFRKIVLMRQGIENKLMFAVDSYANQYNVAWAKYIIQYDRELLCRTLPEKYGDFKGFIPPEMAGWKNEDLNPFRKTWENASSRNMLEFLKPW